MPVGSALVSGIVASAVCLLGAAIQAVSPDSSLFWSFFALNLVMLLLSYLPVFPAFLALRQRFPDAERPFRVPGGGGFLKCLAYVPMALIALSIVFTAVPLSTDRETLATILPLPWAPSSVCCWASCSSPSGGGITPYQEDNSYGKTNHRNHAPAGRVSHARGI